MRRCRYAVFSALVMTAVISTAICGWGHDHTAKKFEREQAVALAARQATTEQAPRGEGREGVCRLTLDLLLDEAPQPVAGLVRITNLTSGKELSLADEIHRDKNWYAVAPHATLPLPRAKLKIEALHGLVTELTTREIDLSGKSEDSLSLTLKRFYDPAARGLKAG